MLTGKERAALRAKASGELTLFQIGKGGVSESVPAAVRDALEARELVKIRVLESSGIAVRDAAVELAQDLGAEVVQVIGARFVLYKKKAENGEKKHLSGKTRRTRGKKPPVGNKKQAEGTKRAAYSSKVRGSSGRKRVGK